MKIPFPKPRPAGFFALFTASFCFAAGLPRNEPVLALSGVLFAVCLAYCFLSVFLLALIHKKNVAALRTSIVPEKVPINGRVALRLSQKIYFFQLPAVLIRYKLLLSTKDNKKIECVFGSSFFKNAEAEFMTLRRGAYYGAHDELAIQDVLGFFYRPLKLYQGIGERLLALPSPAESCPPMPAVAGGADGRSETASRKTDDLTEQRPYIPGDDPRRINWKLYAHAGELFIRQEERSPPPRSRFILLIDTEADASLYSESEGAAAVDALCRAALSLFLENAASGGEALFGFTGGDIKSMTGGAAELATPLAYPARCALDSGQRLPDIPVLFAPCVILVFALSRGAGKRKSSLQNFIEKNRGAVRILFSCDSENQKNAAEGAAVLFNRLPGVSASATRFCL